ncbi:MAG: amidohydrolase [Acidobacteria bacterium]|nr:MAG: amidohydrolase [Acidobacteriota bacterium]
MVVAATAAAYASSAWRGTIRGDMGVRGADLILLNGKIWTGEPEGSGYEAKTPTRIAQAVAVAGGRILDVGANEEMENYRGSATQVIDAQGRLVLPGFIDAHVHFMDGSFQLLEIDLKHTRDEQDFVARLAEKAKTLAPGQWMLGGDWDEEAWPDAKLPTRWMIDAVTLRNPVWISRYDGHAALANSLALKLAGVTKETQPPAGGVMVRDAKTGEPTGVFKDAAQSLIDRAVPRPSEAEAVEALRAGLAEAARDGVTSVEDMAVGSNSPDGSFTGIIRLLRKAELEGWLTCRFFSAIPIENWKKLAEAGISRNLGDDFIELGAVKAFADGSLGSRTAWMFAPYDDDPENSGLPMPILEPRAKFEAMARRIYAARIQICTHAIGDRAVDTMLDIYEAIGGGDARAHRFRIEHAQHVRREDFARFGRLGVIASMQPYHAVDDGRWAEKRIGRERARTSYAWRSMLRAGAPLAFGTDWPVAPLNPLLGLYAAVTRATLDGKNPAGWFPEEKLTLEEALRAYTQGSAYAAFEEQEKGTIAPHKLADFVVLSDDLFSIPLEKIKDARVLMTVVGGKIVYRSK